MKKNFLLFTALIGTISVFSQSQASYNIQKPAFYEIKTIKATPVKNQAMTGTCWCFSTTSLVESDEIRKANKEIDLSEMFTVRNIYIDKARNYVLRQGHAQFGEGGLSHDMIRAIASYGAVPESAYTGLLNGQTMYNHSKLFSSLQGYLDSILKKTPVAADWLQGYTRILDQYLGEAPSEFTYEGKKYTPQTFFESTKLNPKDYVTISSFTHEPFYKPFLLDIPDNFSNGLFYNMPLDEFIQNIDNALDNGYTLSLDADVSEGTFGRKNGIAVIPQNEGDAAAILTEIKPEKNITPEYRQSQFENFSTTDDHLMHIVGKVKDQKGNMYYKVKNSWGTKAGYDGYYYMSVPYMKLKAISVLLHKDGLSAKTKTSLGV